MKKSEALTLAGNAGRGSKRDLEKLLRGIVGGDVGGGDLPELAEVAYSGDYNDLNGLPVLGTVAELNIADSSTVPNNTDVPTVSYAGKGLPHALANNSDYNLFSPGVAANTMFHQVTSASPTGPNRPADSLGAVLVDSLRGSTNANIKQWVTQLNGGRRFERIRVNNVWGDWSETPPIGSWRSTGRDLAAADSPTDAKDILGISNLDPVPAPEGGSDVDIEARAAIDLIIARLVEAGILTADS